MAQDKQHESPEYVRYVHEIIDSFAKDMKEEFGLACIGRGGGMPYDVEHIAVAFAAYRKASIEEARKLEVQATEKLLQRINAHERIRPYLREYPFPVNRTDITISFYKTNKTPHLDGSISLVFQVKSKIFYYANDSHTKKSEELFEESYSDAVKALGDQNKIPPNFSR